ncbi:MAG: peroxiredoxin [Lachnospiraceae bacterium]|nr:peroxiredoxin [Lachnospiraceae bacterium]
MDNENLYQMPLLGELSPSFEAITTQGKVTFPQDYEGSWVVLFSHPADFTPVCTTELMTFASMADEFEALNTKLIGLSVDSLHSHIAWIRTMNSLEWKGMKNMDIKFPIIEDIKMEIAHKFGMMQPKQSTTHAVRAVFIIDPKGIIRTILYYPLSTGRNFAEIKRIISALQKTDEESVSTPADWQVGDDVIMHAPTTCEAVKERVANKDDNLYCLDWFLCFKKEKGGNDKI